MKFQTQHEDIIHDLAYDYYGRRLATCSSDQRIKVWDMDTDGSWKLSAEWKAHSGSVWKLDWAHAEFGQVLASCSFDRQVQIWEEVEKNKWVSKAQLTDSRDSVNHIKFAPHHLGLKLASCSADGVLRIYEAPDVMNLSHWTLQDEFEVQKNGVTSVAWNPSRFDANETVAMATGDTVKIWMRVDQRKWVVVATLADHTETDTVHDVAWAPNLGRSYHLLATASKDRLVRIWKVILGQDAVSRTDTECVCRLDNHKAEVWRVEWNIAGTILASSGDDGAVRLWKTDALSGAWKALSTVTGDEELLDQSAMSS